MNFNHSQMAAIAHFEGPALVLAGPGSGKTAVVTQRVKTLISQHHVNPSNILVITFTKAAANEMKERFLKLTGADSTPVYFGTFHGVFFAILKHAYHYTAADIITEAEQFEIIRKIMYKLQIECEDEKELAGNLLGEISHVKGGLMDISHYYPVNCGQEVFRTVFEQYEAALHNNHKIDFDDMLVFCYELFRERKDILAAWQNKFQYILIDEFQDINPAQYSVVKMLAAPQNNVFVVGDDDQSIYGFRGANPEIMLNFEHDYPGCSKILLDVNYRSQKYIVEGAIRVINHNRKRFAKDIKAFRAPFAPIEVCCYPEIYDENSAVIERIRKCHEEGMEYRDIAILTRVNVGARLIAERLHEYNIPFQAKDVIPNIYDHWIAQNIFSYIKIALGNRERREFLSIINRPKRYVSRDMFDMPQVDLEEVSRNYFDKPWMAERIERLKEDIEMLAGLNPFGAVNYIRRVIGYDEFLNEYARDRGIKAEDLFDIINELQESAREFNTYSAWFEHMEKYREQLKNQNRSVEENAVNIMTMHGSKGLEYKLVIILDANEGVMPYKKAILDSELEEERRMFYVAMTRAKDSLVICHVKTRYNKLAAMSRFLTELLEKDT
jgi:DNA helicase-2/ATP-dependent DNA helicase PcrA